MTAPEFSRPERVDTIGVDVRHVVVTADEAERAALARRFDIAAVVSLSADFTLRRDAAGIEVAGRVGATLTQACSITGDPLATSVDESISLRFVAAGDEREDEIELDDSAIDVIAHAGGTIDLGEVAAETMALAIDPFPRGPGADAALQAAGVLSEGEAGPFGALAALKAKLGG